MSQAFRDRSRSPPQAQGSRPVHPVVVCSNRSNYKLYAVYACSYMMYVKKKMYTTYGSNIYATL